MSPEKMGRWFAMAVTAVLCVCALAALGILAFALLRALARAVL